MDPSSIRSKMKVLPYVSGPKPFRMNTAAHKLYCADILCYRKEKVYLSREQVMIANSMGLFNPDAVLDDTGIAKGKHWLVFKILLIEIHLLFA